MKQKTIAHAIKDYALDQALSQKSNNAAAIRARKRARQKQEDLARRKRLKDIVFFTLYGILLIFFTTMVSMMFIKIIQS